MLIFITGGVRSGKSSFAEKLATQQARQLKDSREGLPAPKLYYLATSQEEDVEMGERVKMHRRTRDQSGANWITWEQPRNIEVLTSFVTSQDVVLLDCLTTLLSNELFVGWEKGNQFYEEAAFRMGVVERILRGIDGFRSRSNLIVVSNELCFHPIFLNQYDRGTYYYMKLLGLLHQRIVAASDQAYQVEFGINLKWKG